MMRTVFVVALFALAVSACTAEDEECERAMAYCRDVMCANQQVTLNKCEQGLMGTIRECSCSAQFIEQDGDEPEQDLLQGAFGRRFGPFGSPEQRTMPLMSLFQNVFAGMDGEEHMPVANALPLSMLFNMERARQAALHGSPNLVGGGVRQLPPQRPRVIRFFFSGPASEELFEDKLPDEEPEAEIFNIKAAEPVEVPETLEAPALKVEIDSEVKRPLDPVICMLAMASLLSLLSTAVFCCCCCMRPKTDREYEVDVETETPLLVEYEVEKVGKPSGEVTILTALPREEPVKPGKL